MRSRNEVETGLKPAELCRKYGISEAMYYNWKAKFGGMTGSEAQRLKEPESENARLKRLLAESMLDSAALKLPFIIDLSSKHQATSAQNASAYRTPH